MKKQEQHLSTIEYGHLGRFLVPSSLSECLRLAAKALRTHDFDTIAFRGMSGAFLAPTLAVRLNKQMILVRKPEDTTHFRVDVEGYRKVKRYIIVDDLVSSGRTKEAIIDGVKTFAPDSCYVGTLEVKHIWEDELNNFIRDKTPYPLS